MLLQILVPPHLCVSFQRSPPQRPLLLQKVRGQPSPAAPPAPPPGWSQALGGDLSWVVGPASHILGSTGHWAAELWPLVCRGLPAESHNKTICCSLMPLKEQYHKPDVTGLREGRGLSEATHGGGGGRHTHAHSAPLPPLLTKSLSLWLPKDLHFSP